MKHPKISIIMGVYNAETTLPQALNSLLDQTYTNFELIVCDDGSEDASYEVLLSYVNKFKGRMIVLKNKQNMGLNYTLNQCLKKTKGKFIARMDADDVSKNNRLEKQVSFLEEHKEFDIVSSSMIYFDEYGPYAQSNPVEKPQNKDFMTTTSPFAHAAAMVTRKAYMDVNGYSVDKKYLRVEDFHLWTKMYAKGYRGYNMSEPLYMMRNDSQAIKRRSSQNRVNEARVKIIAVNKLQLPKTSYIYAFLPIIKIFVPNFIYKKIHFFKMKKGLTK